MKYIQLSISIIILTISSFICYKVVQQQSKNQFDTKIAIIDSDKLIDESIALQDARQQIKNQSSELQQNFESEIEKFRPLREEFELLSEEAKKQRTEQFDRHALNARNSYAKKMSHLEKKYRDAVDSIFNKIKKVAKEAGEKNKVDLILLISKKNQVLYSMNDSNLEKVDLSDEVLHNINKEIPQFTFE